MALKEEEYYKALRFAASAHEGQKDLDGLPYILHPARVAEQFILNEELELAIPAVLHDVIEDTPITYDCIKREFGHRVAQLVLILSRKKNETYVQYIERVAADPAAIKIKLADIRDNMYRRGECPSGMEKRYIKAIATLVKAACELNKHSLETGAYV